MQYKQDIRGRFEIKNKVRYFLMKNLQLTQTEFAQKIGVNKTYLSAIVRGRKDPSLASAMLIAKGLGEPVEEVFQLVEKKSEEEVEE